MQSNHTKGSLKQILKQSPSDAFRLGFLTLIVYAFFRPILSILENMVEFPIHIVFPTFVSYFLLLILLGTLVKARLNLDTVGMLIIIFCTYIFCSFAWGSSVENIVRNTLPFITFFAAHRFLDSPRKARFVIFALIVGYIIPIAGSSVMIFSDVSIVQTEYYSKVERQAGLYIGMHSLAHAMGFFSFLFAFFLENRKSISALRKYIVYITFILSIYCLWNTYVRSVFLGLLIFWSLYFFLWRKRYFLVFFSGLLPLVLWKLPDLTNIFFKAQQIDMDGASSGRITLWAHNLKLYSEWPFYCKLLGGGLGVESKSVIGGKYDVWSSHNDWISLLMTIGAIGLIWYGAIIITLVKDIIRSNIDRRTKALFLSTVIMSSSLSFFTNAYPGRFEMSQMFWLFMGCFYCYRNNGVERESKMD